MHSFQGRGITPPPKLLLPWILLIVRTDDVTQAPGSGQSRPTHEPPLRPFVMAGYLASA